MGREVGGSAVAVVCLFLGFCCLVLAARGTYVDVWHALGSGKSPAAPAQGGGGGGAGNVK